jgi:type I restriction enzyme, R subunit
MLRSKLMMHPYQIYAVKAIVDCIHQNCGMGYIWHTTGSGKTLTSFKASTLLKDNPFSHLPTITIGINIKLN